MTIADAPAKPKAKKKDDKPLSRASELTDDEVINIAMNALDQLQVRFGRFYTINADGDKEPALLVLPLSLDFCRGKDCGVVIRRSAGAYCKIHSPKDAPN